MNRPIKFRVWYPKYKEMDLINSLYFFEENSIDCIPEDTDRLGMVIMQFTGLLDKNGVEIYEGDIVKGNNEWNTHGDTVQVVRYVDGTWNYSYALHEYAEHPEREWEVIGNIYETPELFNEREV